jgi:uncharacterized protein YegL
MMNRTELVFIIDRSGSMGGLENDTIGGFNSLLEEQKEVEGQVTISTILFDNLYEVIHNRMDIKEVKPLSGKEYFVRGTTALLDAVGRSISRIHRDYCETLREERPNKVMFIITTDGFENASREYSYSRVRNYIQEMKAKYDWEFIFIGANIDAVREAKRFGINEERAVRYHADSVGTKKNYKAMGKAVTSYRTCVEIDENWKNELEKDYNNRK